MHKIERSTQPHFTVTPQPGYRGGDGLFPWGVKWKAIVISHLFVSDDSEQEIHQILTNVDFTTGFV